MKLFATSHVIFLLYASVNQSACRNKFHQALGGRTGGMSKKKNLLYSKGLATLMNIKGAVKKE